mgnify:CR=1 FL=1
MAGRTRNTNANKSQRRAINSDLKEFLTETGLDRNREYVYDTQNTISKISIDKSIKCLNPKQKQLIKSIMENEIIFVRGAAGTGKTLLTLKAALELLKKADNPFSKVLLTKPIIEAQENRLGFLPGGIEEKIDPYMDSFISSMNLLIGKPTTSQLITAKVVETNPLPYMRGDTFRESIAILDEAQNVTVGGMRLFLSRKHESCKMIILGDEDQTDLRMRHGEKNGLQDAFERFQGIDNIAFVSFTEDEIVRSTILIEMMKRYRVITPEENSEDQQ